MTVIERNFFRLLRIGVFATPEPIEPLSSWKWRRLYQLSLIHGVANYVWQGIETSHNDPFVALISPQLKEKWANTIIKTEETEEDAQSLTNPLLDNKLQAIIDQESAKEETPTRVMLLNMVRHTRIILNEGVSLLLLIELAQMIRQTGNKIDYDKLQIWISQLHMQPMADLQGTLLITLLGIRQNEIPFMKKSLDNTALQLTKELFNTTDSSTDEWYFTQKENQIFVRTHNSRAMFWHVGHSARYSRLYPSEAITNFFKSFAKSLTHIEE